MVLPQKVPQVLGTRDHMNVNVIRLASLGVRVRQIVAGFVEECEVHLFDRILRERPKPVSSKPAVELDEVCAESTLFGWAQGVELATMNARLQGEPAQEPFITSVLVDEPAAR
jgi:hypothetical protein